MNQEALKSDNFKTVLQPGESLYKEKGSKFIGLTFSASSAEEAEEAIKEVRAKYHDARHVCYAYRTNPAKPEIRANDDGEPNNSAGMPIFNQIQSYGLWNSVVAVVRYFGGTKLGVSGLITAYKEAAQMAIDDSRIERQFIKSEIKIAFPYDSMNDIMRLIKEYDADIVNDDMGKTAGYTLSIRQKHYEELLNKLNSNHLVRII